MHLLKKILTSNHTFSDEENLERFRFSLLNSILIISTLFTLVNLLASLMEFITLSTLYEVVLLIYVIINLLNIFLLRTGKSAYIRSVNIAIFTSLLVFYFALFTAPTDEFRLIWFFLVLFGAFVLIGREYGLFLMFFILSSILVSNIYIDLNYSRLALFTFFNSFLIFTAFAYFFLEKIEKDAQEFKKLNNQLKAKVSKEVQHRKQQESLLLQQCRMASMGEMLDSIAHQWRQPLMNINAILMNMERGIEIRNDPKHYLENKMDEVINLTTHMSQTIEDFRLLFSDNKNLNYFEFTDALSYTLHLFGNILKEFTITICQPKQSTIYGHKNELIQVLVILLSNAIEILKSRGITNKTIRISIEPFETGYTFSIEDNAGGIDKKIIHRIFDPYFTTKTGTGGTGIGLYIAKIIVEHNMHGEISVINTDQGAKFTLKLPKMT